MVLYLYVKYLIFTKNKKAAIEILGRVEEGEEVATSIIHVSEAINIVEARVGLRESLEFIENALATENLSILPVSRGSYEEALFVALRYGISPNDAVAALLSEDLGITEVYSFDKHFDNVPFITRIME
ncbi:MAG: type II toxin-antitoxin system VapC family toxin [Candidatus Bathyarchaeia archaeon]